MKNSHSASRNHVPDKVKINLDMLGALMLHRVSREIHSTDVVEVDNGGMPERTTKLLKKLS